MRNPDNEHRPERGGSHHRHGEELSKHDRLQGLAGFLSGYFHQDWDLEGANPTELVESFVHSEDPHLVVQVDREIELLLERRAKDDELAGILFTLGSCYDLRPSGVSPSEWLADVRRIIAVGRASDPES